jgi:hypothetical protein
MKNKKYSLFIAIIVLIGLAVISCSIFNSYLLTSTPIIVASATPSITPSPIPRPTVTLMALPMMTPYPTDIPYPTATTVNANAVAFVTYNNSLWIANIDGSGERKLADIIRKDSLINVLLQWSPNGKWISYRSDDDLWMISRDGSVKRKLLSFPDKSIGTLYTYVWSPDSSNIAYVATHPYEDNGPTPITVALLDVTTDTVSEIFSHQPTADPMPISWSPNGRYLLIAKGYSYVVYEVATRKVVKEIKLNGMGCWVGWDTWSPNNEWFFDNQHGNGRYAMDWICVSGLDGSNRQIYVDGTTSDPVWDKTGNILYFVARKTNPDSVPNLNIDERLMRYDIRTQKTERLLPLRQQQTVDYIQSVSISPDRSTLLLQTKFSETKFDLIFVDIHSLTTTDFTLDFTDLKIPLTYDYFLQTAWSPDSQNLILLAGDVCSPSGCIQYYGSFYTLNVKTEKINIFSGNHAIESWVVSPVATSP